MPSLKAIRKRIVSVKNTRKITRAMKLVAAAKLRRAQDAIIAARPYSAAIARVVSELSAVAGKESHPLFEERELKKAAIVVITSDRGLAGAYVTRVVQLLPVVPETVPQTETDYIYEPSKQELLTRLVPLFVQIQLYRAALESIAGFFGAQMMAMENATKNAGEMINRYTLQYNRARQAAITKELLEIIGGAE